MQKVTSAPLPDSISCPPSKSYANRALLLAAITEGSQEILNLPRAQDVVDLLDNFRAAGLLIQQGSSSVVIPNTFPGCERADNKEVMLPGSEGGTTIRFLMTLLSLGKRTYLLPLKGRMGERPLKNQIKCLTELGANIELKANFLRIQGPIQLTDKVTVDCSDTTQFATSMLLLQSQFPFDLELSNNLFSTAYLEMTRKVVSEFGDKYVVPSDFSSLSYPAAYAFINQRLLVSNVFEIDRAQADSYLFTLFSSWNLTKTGLEITENKSVKCLDVDVSTCLDLFPTLAYMSVFLDQDSQFFHLLPLKDKESDRLEEVLKVFRAIGQKYEYSAEDDRLYVFTGCKLAFPDSLELPNDHRIVMMAALIAKQLGGGKIQQFQSVRKSFPNFFNYFS